MDLALEHDREKELQKKWEAALPKITLAASLYEYRRVVLFGFLVAAGIHERLAQHIADNAPENGWKLNL